MGMKRLRIVSVTLAVTWLVTLRYIFSTVHQADLSSSSSFHRDSPKDFQRPSIHKRMNVSGPSSYLSVKVSDMLKVKAPVSKLVNGGNDDHDWITLPPNFDPSTHNQTVRIAGDSDWSSHTLPGLFWEQRLWLLGVRLTTNYDDDSSSAFVTVFGMPGDFHKRVKEHEIRCPANSWYNDDNGTVFSYPQAHTQVLLFASLSDGQLYPLEFLRTVSGDTNQNNNTLIWHGVIPIDSIGDASLDPRELALRTTIHASLKSQEMSQVSAVPILTVDIPLSTGVVGQAGPQIVGSTNENARDAALCVAIYGNDALYYLPEFVLHHTNLGFGPVIVGIVDATIGSEKMQQAHEALRDFVDQGLVDIAAMGLPSPLEPALECEVNVRKQHFYNTCLYHAKGRTPYVGIWDIDEFWVPPLVKVDNTVSENKHPIWKSGNADDIWSTSNYSTSLSVGQVLAHIQKYQDHFGCGESWCYHAFPSLSVWLRRQPKNSNELASRKGRILEDFQMRTTDLDWEWSKSITRTKYAFMGGLHQTGSCRFATTPQGAFVSRKDVLWTEVPYEKQSKDDTAVVCRNLILGKYGIMHHFRSLNRVRSSEMRSFQKECLDDDDKGKSSTDADGESCVMDEYIERFGETVQQQLEAREKRLSEHGGS